MREWEKWEEWEVWDAASVQQPTSNVEYPRGYEEEDENEDDCGGCKGSMRNGSSRFPGLGPST